MPRPNPKEHVPYFARYIDLVPEEDVVRAMEAQLSETLSFLRSIPESQSLTLHPPYTWTAKEVLGHLIDSERIFTYRALRFARGDQTPLPGFDENAYVTTAPFKRVPLDRLLAEFEACRRAHVLFFGNLGEDAWLRSGDASGNKMSVGAIAYTIVGHVRHHMAILRKRFAVLERVSH